MDEDTKTPMPMYVEDFDKRNKTDLDFWGREIVAPCHPTAGFDVQYQGAKGAKPTGLVRLNCHECGKTIGKIVVGNDPRVPYPAKLTLLS